MIHYSTLMVILLMPCWGCRVVSHGMAIPSDAFTHRILFYSHFRFGNKYGKKYIICENIG